MTSSVDGLRIRPLADEPEYLACVELQQQTWGQEADLVAFSTLKVVHMLGGVLAGAFDSGDRLVGFVFGMLGRYEGKIIHWSDMMAVRPEWRGRGVGRWLKDFQRRQVKAQGLDTILWTFDPLEARNAQLNLVRLGVRVVDYVVDFYGSGASSTLHRGLGTDRWIVAWDLSAGTEVGVREGSSLGSLAESPPTPPFVNAEVVEQALVPTAPALTDADMVAVAIPDDIQAVKARSAEQAWRWRQGTREAFLHYLERGYTVEGFQRHRTAGGGVYRLRSKRCW